MYADLIIIFIETSLNIIVKMSNYASVGGATRHTVVRLCMCHYASVGGATRHTVIALSVCLSFCLSVTPFSRRTLKGKL